MEGIQKAFGFGHLLLVGQAAALGWLGEGGIGGGYAVGCVVGADGLFELNAEVGLVVAREGGARGDAASGQYLGGGQLGAGDQEVGHAQVDVLRQLLCVEAGKELHHTAEMRWLDAEALAEGSGVAAAVREPAEVLVHDRDARGL